MKGIMSRKITNSIWAIRKTLSSRNTPNREEIKPEGSVKRAVECRIQGTSKST
jgi:hypothetical protein